MWRLFGSVSVYIVVAFDKLRMECKDLQLTTLNLKNLNHFHAKAAKVTGEVRWKFWTDSLLSIEDLQQIQDISRYVGRRMK